MTSSVRLEVLNQLLQNLQDVHPERRILVAIDGFEGAGKTWLTSELVDLSKGGRPAVQIGIDGFFRSRQERYANGKSASTYYREAYDYDSFMRLVVEPLRDGKPVVPAIWDVDNDLPVAPVSMEIPEQAIVFVDGVFLHRKELMRLWDASVWLRVPLDVAIPRGNARYPGMDLNPKAPSNLRHVAAQRLYINEARPEQCCTWVFFNQDLDNPQLKPGPRHTGAQFALRK